MKKFQALASQSIEYANDVALLATLISGLVEGESSGIRPGLIKKYFAAKDTDKPIAIITVAPTRGFCGSLISDMINVLKKNIDSNQEYSGIGIQKKAWYIMSKFPQIKIETSFEKPIESPDFNLISGSFDYVMDNYFAGKYSKVLIYFTEFNGSFDYQPVIKQLLPLKFSDLIQYVDTDEEKQALTESYVLEPNKNKLFEDIVVRYLKTMFLFALITSKASEHNARMIAMKNATDNANQLKDVLNLQYNKSRQEAITTELLDIIGGTINN
jgi:F-type H+-transporting ATPase subunit gamma